MLPAVAQNDCYIQLDEASGFDVSPYQAELDAKACELVAAFPDSTYADSFKVFGFGFYAEMAYYDTYSYPQAFLDVKDMVAGMSPYYLLIGRQSDPDGIFTKFWVDVKLPEGGSLNMDCFSETSRILLKSSMEIAMNRKNEDISIDPYRYSEVELLGMDTLTSFIENLIECCDPETRSSCYMCANSNTILNYFLSRGFDTFQMKVVGVSWDTLTGGQNVIEDFANLLVEIEGDTVNLAEVLLEGFSETFFDSLNVKGIFTKDDNFCDESFLTAKSIWENSNFDFIQWVHYSQITAQDETKFVLFNIKEGLSNVEINNLPAIEAFFAPPTSEIPGTYDIEEVKSIIVDIFQKNDIEINVTLLDKDTLDILDLWITLINRPDRRIGFSDLFGGEPRTRKVGEVEPYPGSYVNYWKVKGQSEHSEEYYNYRIGYIASHEFLHQVLNKAHYYIFVSDGTSSYLDWVNPIEGRHFKHRLNLLSDAGDSLGVLPKKRQNHLIDVEKIVEKHRDLIFDFLFLRKLEINLPDEARKYFFPIWGKFYKEKYLLNTDYFSK